MSKLSRFVVLLILVTGGIALGFLPLMSCGIPVPAVGVSAIGERIQGPEEESEWNQKQLWYLADRETSTYLPLGYPSDKPRTNEEGAWFVDTRGEGKRLFIPYSGVGDYTFKVLVGEAKNACFWKNKDLVYLKPTGFAPLE